MRIAYLGLAFCTAFYPVHAHHNTHAAAGADSAAADSSETGQDSSEEPATGCQCAGRRGGGLGHALEACRSRAPWRQCRAPALLPAHDLGAIEGLPAAILDAMWPQPALPFRIGVPPPALFALPVTRVTPRAVCASWCVPVPTVTSVMVPRYIDAAI